jgi:hypothetical protein
MLAAWAIRTQEALDQLGCRQGEAWADDQHMGSLAGAVTYAGGLVRVRTRRSAGSRQGFSIDASRR